MDIGIEAGKLQDANRTASEYRNKSILLSVTHALCGPTRGVHIQFGPKGIGFFHVRGAQAQLPLVRSSGTGVLRRAQLQTRHPRVGKLWAPRQRRQQPDRSGGGRHRFRDKRIIPMTELHLQGVPFSNHIVVPTQVVISRRVHRHRLALKDG